jgi:hypothetical protein
MHDEQSAPNHARRRTGTDSRQNIPSGPRPKKMFLQRPRRSNRHHQSRTASRKFTRSLRALSRRTETRGTCQVLAM